MKGLSTCLWFDGQAEEAARFYTSIFPNSKMGNISRYGAAGAEASGNEEGSVMMVEFELDGRPFMGLNGGPEFPFTEAISLVVNCETQEEVDYYWAKLSEGGQEGPCGWLKDKFGLSWQITPVALLGMVTDEDAEKAERAMKAMLEMSKLDIATLKRAYEGQ